VRSSSSAKPGNAAGQETRQAVLKCALRLFNERGVDRVSMRDVAAEAGISVGNLTYHFPRKKDLVTTLMAEDVQERLVQTPTTGLLQLDQAFSRMLDALLRFPFFFLDDQAQQMVDAPVVNGTLQIHGQLDHILDDLIALGLFSPAFQGTQRRDVMAILLLSHISWLKFCVRGNQVFPMSGRELLDAHWAVLRPWLTEAGQRECAEMLKNRRENEY